MVHVCSVRHVPHGPRPDGSVRVDGVSQRGSCNQQRPGGADSRTGSAERCAHPTPPAAENGRAGDGDEAEAQNSA